MTDIEIADHHALQSLVFEFARRVDFEAGSRTEELFTPDGYYEYDGRSNRGRADIKKAYDVRRDRGIRTARHVFTNLCFWREDDELRGRSIMLLFGADGPPPIDFAAPIVVGDVLDRYATVDGRHFIAHRVITPIFVEQGRPAVLPLGAH